LFGRNASAGLINIISKKPSFNFEGYGSLTYGNFDYVRADAGVTGPIGETLAFRLDGVYNRRDGFYKVVNAAGGTESRVNNRNRMFVRGQLLFEPNDALEVRIIGDYTHRKESCCGATFISTLETYDPTPGVPGDFAVRQPGEGGSPSGNRIVDVLTSLGGTFPAAGDPFNRNISITPGRTYEGVTRDWGVSAQADYDFGGATLTSITGYRDYKAGGPTDTDYGNVDILYRADDGNIFRQFKTFSQELRLQGSAFSDHLDWLVGAYYANEDLHVRDNIKFGTQYGAFAACRLVATVSPNPVLRNPAAPGCLSPAATAPGSPFSATGALGGAGPIFAQGLRNLSTVNNVGDDGTDYNQDSTNWALFTHNIFNITDKLALTIGLRYTHEKKDFSAQFNNTNNVCPAQQAFFSNFLPGGATPLPAALQALAQGVVNLTCQGNATSALNALNLQDQRSEDEWTGTGVFSWKPTRDFMTYVSYSKGYKAGGFNLDRSALGCPFYAPTDTRQTTICGTGFGSANLQFDAEKVDAYEFGAKYGHRGLSFSLAIFRQEFKDFQLNTFNGSVFLVQNINGCGANLGTTDQDISPNVVPYVGGSAYVTGACPADQVGPGVISEGVEIESAFAPHRDLQFTAGVTYANTHYKNDLVGRNTGAPLDPALFLLPGDNLSNAPEFVATFSMAFTPAIGSSGMEGLFYVDGRISDEYNTGSDLFPEKEQEAFALFNARVGLRGPQQRWAVELWAQNLFNQDYQQVAFNTPFQGSNSRAHITSSRGGGAPGFATANQLFSSYLAEPRTFGITGRFRF
jgi:outer membrane receptor protein involved in Fe transport